MAACKQTPTSILNFVSITETNVAHGNTSYIHTSLAYLIVLAAIHNRLPQLLRGTTTILHAVVKVYLLMRSEHITKIRIT